ncbi:MAG: hypothetical protein QM803_17535 [Rhodocyclaceae bacterium]
MLVLRGVAGSVDRIDGYVAVAAVVARHRITTVADGDCTNACAMLFVSGAQRRFAQRPDQAPGRVAISGARVMAGNATVTSNAYSFYRSALRNMPFGLLNRYAGGGSSGALYALQPDAAHPQGALMECPTDKLNEMCEPAGSRTALSTGVITSVEPFVLAPYAPPTPVGFPQPAGNAANPPAPASPPGSPPASRPPATAQPVATQPAQTQPLSNMSVTLFIAMLATKMEPGVGPSGAGSRFSTADDIVAYAAFQWSGGVGGSHIFETRWYRGDDLVYRGPSSTVQWNAAPGAAWQVVPARLLGAGSYRTVYLLDGKEVATKAFTVE